MNKKKFLLLPFLALALMSCSNDAGDDGLSSWLSNQGMPSSYKVQTVTVNDLNPLSAEVSQDSLPRSAWTRGFFGALSGMSHDLFLDFGMDSASLAKVNAGDSGKSLLFLYLVKSFYESEFLPSDYFPIKEDLKLNVSWILSDKLSGGELNDVASLNDSVWFHELESWKAKTTADTTVSISVNKKGSTLADSILTLEMPKALVNEIRKKPGNRRLQLRVSAPEASHVYRIEGAGHMSRFPRFRLVSFKNDTTFNYVSYEPNRAATISLSREECSDCIVLHGGAFDTLKVEFPSKPILKALSDFYGDEFPYSVGDSNDVRQAVVMAQLTFYRDDSKGERELGMPLQVVAGSYMDSAETVVLRKESYKLDKPRIAKSEHPNMLFHEGDSISLQVTAGLRDFINKASDGRTFKMTMRLGFPVLTTRDTVFSPRVSGKKDSIYLFNGETMYVSQGDTINVLFSDFDYARYDWTSIRNKPATLKLWLASKRGDK